MYEHDICEKERQKEEQRQQTAVTCKLTFPQAYMMMLRGYKITRPSWGGYWYISPKTHKVVIHLADGKEIDENFSQETIVNCLAEDWQIIH